MDTVTFVATPVVSDNLVLLFAALSFISFAIVYFIANKVFHGYSTLIWLITAVLGLLLSIIVNFLVYILFI